MQRENIIEGLIELKLGIEGHFTGKNTKEWLTFLDEAISLLQPSPIEDEKVMEALFNIHKDYALGIRISAKDLQIITNVAERYLSNNLAVGMASKKIQNLEACLKNECENEEEARKIAESVLTEYEVRGDTYGVPMIQEVVQLLVNKILASRFPKKMSREIIIRILDENCNCNQKSKHGYIADKIIAEGKD